MKKVGLVTCFLDNYGACLQALALQQQINSLGCQCDIIAYVGNHGYAHDNFFSALKMEIKNYAYTVWNNWHLDGKVGPYTRKLAFYGFRKRFLEFNTYTNTKITKYYDKIDELYTLQNKYDVFVCGSDQIWNPTFYGKNHPVHFLRFAGDKKRVAYAPSIGLYEMPTEYQQTFIEYINDFDCVSVRERAGSNIIKDLCAREAKVVLDPTLLIGSEFWENLINTDYQKPFEKYIFCYIFSNTSQCSEYLESVQAKTQLPIVYVNVSKLKYDNVRSYCAEDKSPIEFLQLIKNAEFVVTDSFHGTAFSLLLNKEFYVFKREIDYEKIDMFSRIDSILEITNLKNRIVELDSDFTVKEKINYSDVNLLLAEFREDSNNYLKESILGENE